MNHILSTISLVSLFMVFSLLTILAFVGNVFVVLSVFKCPRLRAQSCFHFLAGLAVADICVTILVMPWSIIYVGYGYWPLGAVFCKMWMSFDVLCCTASILHLCLVALDRYMAIAYPLRYAVLVNTTRIRWSMFAVWLISALISFVPIHLGWYEAEPSESALSINNHTRTLNSTTTNLPTLINTNRPMCNLEVNIPYAIISSSTSFYIPFFVFCLLYGRILCIAHSQALQVRRIRIQSFREPESFYYYSNAERFNQTARSTLVLNNSSDRRSVSPQAPEPVDDSKSIDSVVMRPKHSLQEFIRRRSSTIVQRFRFHSTGCQLPRQSSYSGSRSLHLRSHSAMKNELKAVKTIGLLLGCFMICWLPFFLTYVIRAFCHLRCQYPFWLMTLLTWIGYGNSAANPVLYAFFQKDFRMAVLTMFRQSQTRSINLRQSNNLHGHCLEQKKHPTQHYRLASSLELHGNKLMEVAAWHASTLPR